MPNLIVIDGGKGQLSSAEIALKKGWSKYSYHFFSKRKWRNIHNWFIWAFANFKKEYCLTFASNFKRDESHRFGLAYNLKLREIR